jgi:hypothetical protein
MKQSLSWPDSLAITVFLLLAGLAASGYLDPMLPWTQQP